MIAPLLAPAGKTCPGMQQVLQKECKQRAVPMPVSTGEVSGEKGGDLSTGSIEDRKRTQKQPDDPKNPTVTSGKQDYAGVACRESYRPKSNRRLCGRRPVRSDRVVHPRPPRRIVLVRTRLEGVPESVLHRPWSTSPAARSDRKWPSPRRGSGSERGPAAGDRPPARPDGWPRRAPPGSNGAPLGTPSPACRAPRERAGGCRSDGR